MRLLSATLLLILPTLAACNKGPEKVDAPRAANSAHASGGGGAMSGGGMPTGPMPNDEIHGGAGGGVQSPHGTQNPSGEVEVLAAGEVELAGDYAGVAEGWLFVMTRDPETGAPGYVNKVAVADGAKNEAGNQVVPFELTTGHFAMGAPSGDEFLLVISYDHDGMVESKEGNGTATVDASKGETDHSLTIAQRD